MQTVKERVDTLEQVLHDFILQTNSAVAEMKASTEAFKAEMRDFKAEMRDFKAEMRAFKVNVENDQKERNRQWGALASRLGTIIEDIVAPAVRPAVREYFKKEPDWIGMRPIKRLGGEEYEIDALAVTDTQAFVVEVKTSPKTPHVDELLEKTSLFARFYPEYAGKRVVPILGSIVFPPEVVVYASKKQVYALAFREWQYMDILNFADVGAATQ
ncbi:MAG: hypothetical protein AB1714_03920 [Acidobacteriota bacterium]